MSLLVFFICSSSPPSPSPPSSIHVYFKRSNGQQERTRYQKILVYALIESQLISESQTKLNGTDKKILVEPSVISSRFFFCSVMRANLICARCTGCLPQRPQGLSLERSVSSSALSAITDGERHCSIQPLSCEQCFACHTPSDPYARRVNRFQSYALLFVCFEHNFGLSSKGDEALA